MSSRHCQPHSPLPPCFYLPFQLFGCLSITDASLGRGCEPTSVPWCGGFAVCAGKGSGAGNVSHTARPAPCLAMDLSLRWKGFGCHLLDLSPHQLVEQGCLTAGGRAVLRAWEKKKRAEEQVLGLVRFFAEWRFVKCCSRGQGWHGAS